MGFLWEKFARPAMFGLNAETAHEFGHESPALGPRRSVIIPTRESFGVSVRSGDSVLSFPNPVGIAAGFDKNADRSE